MSTIASISLHEVEPENFIKSKNKTLFPNTDICLQITNSQKMNYFPSKLVTQIKMNLKLSDFIAVLRFSYPNNTEKRFHSIVKLKRYYRQHRSDLVITFRPSRLSQIISLNQNKNLTKDLHIKSFI